MSCKEHTEGACAECRRVYTSDDEREGFLWKARPPGLCPHCEHAAFYRAADLGVPGVYRPRPIEECAECHGSFEQFKPGWDYCPTCQAERDIWLDNKLASRYLDKITDKRFEAPAIRQEQFRLRRG